MAYVSFDELKARLKIEDVAKMLNLKSKESNGQLRSACPHCKTGGDRALVITSSKQAFFCFSAKKGGDMISLASHILDIGPKDAAIAIDKHFGGGQGTRTSATVPVPGTVPVREPLQALTYLEAQNEAVQALGISPETCQAFGAGYAPKGILRGRLAIPLHDRQGALVAYTGRALKDENPLLTFPRDFVPSSLLFNAHRIEQGDFVYVANDPLAVLLAAQNGVLNVVSFLSDITSDAVSVLSLFMDEKEIPAIEFLK